MKVKIGGQIFDPNEVTIAIYLTKVEREHIANMSPDAAIYCQYPDEISAEVMEAELNKFREEIENE